MHNDRIARPWHMDEALHATNWSVHEALSFLGRSDPSCPFFPTVSFIVPHPPAQPPAGGGVGDDVSADRVNLKGEAHSAHS